jgi:hypothetical protein
MSLGHISPAGSFWYLESSKQFANLLAEMSFLAAFYLSDLCTGQKF